MKYNHILECIHGADLLAFKKLSTPYSIQTLDEQTAAYIFKTLAYRKRFTSRSTFDSATFTSLLASISINETIPRLTSIINQVYLYNSDCGLNFCQSYIFNPELWPNEWSSQYSEIVESFLIQNNISSIDAQLGEHFLKLPQTLLTLSLQKISDSFFSNAHNKTLLSEFTSYLERQHLIQSHTMSHSTTKSLPAL